MEVYKRYFRVTSGPLLERVRQLVDQRAEAGEQINALAEELGAEARVSPRGDLAFKFPWDKKPSPDTWKNQDRNGLQVPKKNTPNGKELWKRINALPKYSNVQDALSEVGLDGVFPRIISGGKGYRCTVHGYPAKGVLFVTVPWRKVDQEEMEKYKADRAKRTHFNSELDHLQWQPTAEMEEIPQWKMLKESEELDSQA